MGVKTAVETMATAAQKWQYRHVLLQVSKGRREAAEAHGAGALGGVRAVAGTYSQSSLITGSLKQHATALKEFHFCIQRSTRV